MVSTYRKLREKKQGNYLFKIKRGVGKENNGFPNGSFLNSFPSFDNINLTVIKSKL